MKKASKAKKSARKATPAGQPAPRGNGFNNVRRPANRTLRRGSGS